MEHIGTRIKALRRQRDMTQEKLAEYLNVSFQAVSKWETGVAAPDLSLLVPLTRILGVTADELLGLAAEENDPRKEELEAAWQKTNTTGDTAARLAITQTAAGEYPGDFSWLVMLANAEKAYAIHNCPRSSAEQREYFEKAARHFELVIEDCPDEDLRNSAIYGLVLTLPQIGRREEAIPYARQHPDYDELLGWCLSGEEWEDHRQKMIVLRLDDLLWQLERGQRDLDGLQAAEAIVKLIISDGNYLWYHDFLMHNAVWQAMALTRARRHDEAIEALRKSHHHAVECEKVKAKAKEAPLPYTCPILNRRTFDANQLWYSGMTTLIEDFKEYLGWKDFVPLRERADFAQLQQL